VRYQPRVLDAYLADALKSLAALAIDGCRGVGKTETASRLAKARIDLDWEPEIQALREDPDRVTRLGHPLLIDEWQLYPAVWDRVRRAVDRQATPGMFILTGSATPAEAPKHSGAGRIVHVLMRPFALSERGCAPVVGLGDLLGDRAPDFAATTDVGIEWYADEIVRGGLPGLRAVAPRFRSGVWDGYLAEILDRDLPELGRLVRRRDTLRHWLRAYAAATSSTATYTDILDNATPGDADKPSKATTIAWRDLLHRTWLLDPLPGWHDPLHRLSRLGQAPKHHLVDPALAAHLLGVSADTLLTQPTAAKPPVPRSGTLFGALFESLVTLSVRVYAQSLGASVSHLRTRNGDHEVDLIVTRADGKCLAVEIKSSPHVGATEVRHLHWLQDRLGPDLLDAVVVTSGSAAYRRREDRIGVIPAALLGPGRLIA
jgi:predicted AAA+ superfamily ATPase